MDSHITLDATQIKPNSNIIQCHSKRNLQAIFIIFLTALLANLTKFKNFYYPEHDTLTVYQFFSYFYSEILYNKEIPLWLPYSAYGIPSDSYILFSFGPFQYLSILFGYIFKIKNTLNLFTLSLIFDSIFLMFSSYLFLKHIIRDQLPVIISVILIGLLAQYDVQLYWNFKILLPIPLSLYFAQKWLETLNPFYFLISLANLIIWSFGSLPYVLPFQFYTIACYCFFFIVYKIKLCDLSKNNVSNLFNKAKLQILNQKNQIYSLIPITIICLSATIIFTIKQVIRSEMAYTATEGRSPTLKVSIDSYMNHGGFTDWHKIVEMLTGYPYCKNFLLPFAGIICIALAIIGVLSKHKTRAHFALIMTTCFVIAFSVRETYVARIIYYLPAMNIFRHIGYVITIGKIMLAMLAGFGIKACIDKKKLSKIPFILAILSILFIGFNVTDQFSIANIYISLVIIIFAILNYILNAKSNFFITGLIILGIVEVLNYNHTLATHQDTKARPITSEFIKQYNDLLMARKSIYQYERRQPKNHYYFADTGAFYGISGDYLQTDFIPSLRQDIVSKNLQLLFEKRNNKIEPLFFKNIPNEFDNKILTTGDPKFDDELRKFLGYNASKITLSNQVQYAHSIPKTLSILPKASLSSLPIITIDNPFHTRLKLDKNIRLPHQLDLNSSGAKTRSAVPEYTLRHDDSSIESTKSIISLYTITNTHFSANKHKFLINNFNNVPLWLIYADTNNKNWRAYLDNIQQDIYPANLAFKAVQIPPGSHVVNFVFSKSTVLYKLFFTLQILLGLGIIFTIFSYPFNQSLQQAIDK